MKPNSIGSPDVYHKATTGQYGIVKLLTGEDSSTKVDDAKVNFAFIKSGQDNSSFACKLMGEYDKDFTWNLDKGDVISGSFYKITQVVGILACYPTK
jgi:hypothetical protein